MNDKTSLLRMLETSTLRQSALTTISTVINGALGMLFYIVIARYLGPSLFGVFAVAVTALTLVSDMANLGTDTGLIRFVGKYRLSDKQKALKFLKLGLETKFFVWLIILGVGWLVIPALAAQLFLKSELIVPLRLALVGAGGALLFSYVSSAIQAYQKFLAWSVLNVASNSLRLAVLLLMILAGTLSLDNGLWAYIVVPFLSFLGGLIILPRFLLVKNEFSIAGDFFHYNKWVALFIIIAAVSSRLDTFLVARFLPTSAVGIYAAANQVAGVVPQLVFAIATVAAPKLASFTTSAQAIAYLKKLQILVLGLAGVGLLLLPLAIFTIPWLFGPLFAASVRIFIILFVAQLIFLISLPVHQAIFYYFAKPAVFVVVSALHLLIVGVGGSLIITNYELEGMALVVLVGSISNFILPLLWVVAKFKGYEKDL